MSIITDLSNRPGVNKSVVENFLRNLDAEYCKFDHLHRARDQAGYWKWNHATLTAIEEGIMAIMGGENK